VNRIVVAGGGIAGLAIAHALRQRDPLAHVVVLERSTRPGGNIRTERVDGYTCEWGPDGFLDNAPATLRLVSELGLDAQLQPSNDAARRRFVFRHGQLHEVPVSPGAFLRTRLLSVRGKLRICGEPFASRRTECDETIHAFASRRIGTEAADVLIDSMVSGIFAGDARSLSLRACFPKMWDLETNYGSLVRAMLATRKQRRKEDGVGTPAGRLTSFDGGMEMLVRALARSLDGQLTLGAPVTAVGTPGYPRSAAGPAYVVTTPAGRYEADALVLTGPAADSAALLRPFDATLAGLLDGIATAPLAVVCLGYDEAALAANRGPLDGFGFLVPRNEGIRILGALWESSIYPDRAPHGKTLLRVMIGGAGDRDAVSLVDGALLDVVCSDLRRTMGLTVDPEFIHIVRHRRGIPQYTQGHLDRLQRIETLLERYRGLFLAGNSYRGVAINSCVNEAGQIADRVLASLKARSTRATRVAS
jgi:protoporphyrinogen/coproporphyrinogen III oxidase